MHHRHSSPGSLTHTASAKRHQFQRHSFIQHHSILRRSLKLIPSLLFGITLSWAGGAGAQDIRAQDIRAQDAGAQDAETQMENTPAPAAEPTPTEQAVPNSDAPPELLETLNAIDTAATQGDLATVMSFYSSTFRNSDGFDYATLEQALTELWKRYPNLTYQTQLNSWEADGAAIVAETTTTITGDYSTSERGRTFTATITSRQRFENLQITEQEILAEQSELAEGRNPPTVEVILPEQVAIGQSFGFDAIVQEPLGDRLLLGAALEEQTDASSYFEDVPVTLELLSSGGLFKMGRAPAVPDSHWISAILIRDDGITTVTQRIRIVRPANAASGAQ